MSESDVLPEPADDLRHGIKCEAAGDLTHQFPDVAFPISDKVTC